MLLLMTAAALAGDVHIDCEVALELTLDRQPTAVTWIPMDLVIPDLPPGPHVIGVRRDGLWNEIEIDMPVTGDIQVLVGTSFLESSARVVPAEELVDATTARIELHLHDGAGAVFMLAGTRHTLEPGGVVVLDDVAPGRYPIEVRTADNALIWVRGTLEIEAGDSVVMALTEGRAPEVFGRVEAWQPAR